MTSLSLDDGYAIGQSEFLGRGWEGPSSTSKLSVKCLSSLTPQDDFPPLPPPLVTVTRTIPMSRTCKTVRPCSTSNTCKPVRPCSMSTTCKPVHPASMSAHTVTCSYVSSY